MKVKTCPKCGSDDLERMILKKGTRLFHGTDVPTFFRRFAKRAAWFTQDMDKAKEWAGWSEDGGGGRKRVLELVTLKDLSLVDTITLRQWQKLGMQLMGDDDPRMWCLAKATREARLDGWIGETEVMLSFPESVLRVKTIHFLEE